MGLVVLTEFLMQLLGIRYCPVLDHHLDALPEQVVSPVLAIAAVVFRPHLLHAISALHCGCPRKQILPLGFPVHTAARAIGVLLPLA